LFDEDGDTFRISKEVLPSLEGLDFSETILGDPDGSLRQFRNSTGLLHIREYKDYFEIHKDRVDPRTDPLGHLLLDSPETILALGAATLLTPRLSLKRDSEGAPELSFGNPFTFFRFFLFFNRFFRSLKKLLF
jgi:hypothetical protein